MNSFPNTILWAQAAEAAYLCFKIILAAGHRINMEKIMPRHIVVKLLETKEQEKILQTEKSDLLHREQ